MRKQLATALILGAGLVPDVRAERPRELGQQRPLITPAQERRASALLLARRTHFDHMKCAGKLKRHELATFSLDDGRLWAQWTAPLVVPLPVRVETEEIDAEWIALAPATTDDPGADRAWLLARRDLVPQPDGRFWFVRLYASHADASRIDLLATTEYATPSRRDAITISYSQSPAGVRLQASPSRRLALDVTAPDLRHLAHNHPQATRRHLFPALQRIANLNPSSWT